MDKSNSLVYSKKEWYVLVPFSRSKIWVLGICFISNANQVTESKYCVTHLKSLNVNSDVILFSYF